MKTEWQAVQLVKAFSVYSYENEFAAVLFFFFFKVISSEVSICCVGGCAKTNKGAVSFLKC